MFNFLSMERWSKVDYINAIICEMTLLNATMSCNTWIQKDEEKQLKRFITALSITNFKILLLSSAMAFKLTKYSKKRWFLFAYFDAQIVTKHRCMDIVLLSNQMLPQQTEMNCDRKKINFRLFHVTLNFVILLMTFFSSFV